MSKIADQKSHNDQDKCNQGIEEDPGMDSNHKQKDIRPVSDTLKKKKKKKKKKKQQQQRSKQVQRETR